MTFVRGVGTIIVVNLEGVGIIFGVKLEQVFTMYVLHHHREETRHSHIALKITLSVRNCSIEEWLVPFVKFIFVWKLLSRNGFLLVELHSLRCQMDLFILSCHTICT